MITFEDFKAAVLEELGPDGTRRGIEALRTRAIRDAMVDLQRYIRAYRQGHATTYSANDLELRANAMLGALPSQAKPKALYIYRVASAPAAEAIPSTIESWDDLAAIPTETLAVGTFRIWIEATTGSFKVTQLRAGTDATDTDAGIQRPDDWAAGTNEKVWYQA